MKSIRVLPDWCLGISGAVLLWLSQPPLEWSLSAWIAMVPWLVLATRQPLTRSRGWLLYVVAAGYWAMTMQGIRHANPVFYAVLPVFAFYLAGYSLTFVWLIGRVQRSHTARVPVWIAVPMIGTGLECIRNYLLTGISAAMLGHSQVSHLIVIQIADAFGSYGVTFLVLMVNAAIYQTWFSDQEVRPHRWLPLGVAAGLLVACLGYGKWRLDQADAMNSAKRAGITIALIGRDEVVEFVPDSDDEVESQKRREEQIRRELQIFDAYFQQSIKAAEQVAKTGGKLDAVVWPESMFNGSMPWLLLEQPAMTPSSLDAETVAIIQENRLQYQRRAAQVQAAIRRVTGQLNDPQLIVGCTVLDYAEPIKVYSSVVQVGDRGRVLDWYGKTHLVLIGEYIPFIGGVERGIGPKPMRLGDVIISPNVCIETAVERVTPQHMIELISTSHAPDVIVNVTNDGWFDRSEIVEHHLRCSQLVAVICRRPILISANGGPTVWIDGSGRVIQRLDNDEVGAILVDFTRDGRWGLYQSIGDWPARMLALYCIWLLVLGIGNRWRSKRQSSPHIPLS